MTRTIRNAAALLAVLALALPAAAGEVKEDYREIAYPAIPDFEIPSPTVFTLDNGMKVFLIEDRELPLIEVSARIRTGSIWEPSDKAGLAEMTGAVQRLGGTASMTPDELDLFLESRAASIESSIGSNSGFASMSCLAEDFDEVFAVFSDVMRRPAFAKDKLDLTKVQMSTGIARRNDSINGITSREIARLVYGPDSPLVRMEEYATVDAVTRDDLVAWHARYYHPNNVLIGVVGDFDAKAMRKKVEAVFGEWDSGPASDTPEIAYRQETKPGVYYIEKTDVTQANIVFGHLGIKLDHPRYFAVQVLNEVFAGGFGARLFSNVRSKKGLAYNVYGGIGSGSMHPGTFTVGLQTKSANMSKAVDALREEISGLTANPPTDAEIDRAKQSILNSFIFNYDSRSEILAQQMAYAYYGMPPDFLERFRANIETVTRGEVIEAAKELVHQDRLALLVVGNRADFDVPPETLGETTAIDISIPSRPDTAPRAERTPESLEKGAAALWRMARAIGGEDATSVKAVRSVSQIGLEFQGNRIPLGQTVTVVYPDRLHQSVSSPMGEQTFVLDGDEGFAVAGGAVQPVPPALLEKAREDMSHDLLYIARSAGTDAIEAVFVERDEVGGGACDELALTLTGYASRLCVADDGKVLRQSYAGRDPMTQTPGRVSIVFSDYREIDGRHVPHRAEASFEGRPSMTIEVRSVDFDPEIDASIFEKPAA